MPQIMLEQRLFNMSVNHPTPSYRDSVVDGAKLQLFFIENQYDKKFFEKIVRLVFEISPLRLSATVEMTCQFHKFLH